MNEVYEGKYGYVYMVENKINGMKYIGKCVIGRQNNHLTYLGSGVYLKRAIKKYGKENFSKRVLEFSGDEESLRRLEEYYIRSKDAVRSKEFYNIKYTSIGGDTFSGHPNKESIREKRRLAATGESNSNYGKTASDYCKQRLKVVNSKKIVVDGKEYSSLTEASKYLGVGITTLSYRLRSPNYSNYTYYDDEYQKSVQKKEHKRPEIVKPIKVDGKIYPNIQRCVEETGIPYSTIYNRLRSPNFKEYILLH